MALSESSRAAFLRAASLLAKGKPPSERAKILRNAHAYMERGQWIPAITADQFPLLFYPGDPRRQATLASAILSAQTAGELSSPAPSEPQGMLPIQWALWDDLPPIPADSPLLYWLPGHLPREVTPMAEPKFDPRPSFRAQARPRRIPPELLAMPLDTQVVFHQLSGLETGCYAGTAAQVIRDIDDQIARQESGYFTLGEAAHILTEANPGCDVRDLIARMSAARVDGRRMPRDPGSKLPVLEDATAFAFLWVVSPEDINKWLTYEDVRFRFPGAAEEGSAPEQVAQADPERRLHALRALGGSANRFKNKWTFKGIEALEKAERDGGRKRVSQKTIRADLEIAAEAEFKEGKGGAPVKSWPLG